MLISNRKIPDNLNVIIRNVNRSKVTEIMFLRAYNDQKLTFKFHIDQLANKTSQSVCAIHRISPFIPCNCKYVSKFLMTKSHISECGIYCSNIN